MATLKPRREAMGITNVRGPAVGRLQSPHPEHRAAARARRLAGDTAEITYSFASMPPCGHKKPMSATEDGIAGERSAAGCPRRPLPFEQRW